MQLKAGPLAPLASLGRFAVGGIRLPSSMHRPRRTAAKGERRAEAWIVSAPDDPGASHRDRPGTEIPRARRQRPVEAAIRGRSTRLFASLAAALSIWPTPEAVACGGAPDDPCHVPLGEYRIALPEKVARPGALVWLHGLGGTADGAMRNEGWIRMLAARGMALMAPDGIVTSPRHGTRRNWTVADGGNYARDDVVFLAQAIADAVRRHGVDPERVLLAGFSRGGSMVWDVACRSPGIARAYASVAGAFWEPLPERCAGPADLFHAHGWMDRVVPLEGRPIGAGAKMQGDVFRSLSILRAANGCASRQPDTASMEGGAMWRHWSDCVDARVDLMLHPGGHAIPRGWLGKALDWFEARLAEDCDARAVGNEDAPSCG